MLKRKEYKKGTREEGYVEFIVIYKRQLHKQTHKQTNKQTTSRATMFTSYQIKGIGFSLN